VIRRRDLLAFGAFAGGLAALGAFGAVACKSDTVDPPDRGKILSDISTLVIVPAYSDASTAVKDLDTALTALDGAPSAESLAAARTAWKKARHAWKTTDAFLFGPAADLAITGGAIDKASDIDRIDALVASSKTLDAAAVGGLGANQRGFGAIEVLLFDPAKDDRAMLGLFEAGGRRSRLATLLAANLRTKVDAVRDAWAPGPVDYGGQLARAGRGSTIYAAERQGIDAIVNALIAAAEIVIALRLAKPLGLDRTPQTPAPELVESPRSDVSVDDISAVLEGIENVYFAKRGAAIGLPLADAVRERGSAADDKMRSVLAKAKEAMAVVPSPLRTAVVGQRDPVIAGHAAMRDVKRSLSLDVAAALGTTIGFNVTDGD
jgi:uncharacterized protein